MNAPDANPKGDPKRGREFNPELTPAEFEVQFFDRLLARQPLYEDALRRQAENLSRAGRYDEVLALDQRLLVIRPSDPVVHYNLACTLCRLANLDGALDSLRKALRLGYDDLGHIETDPDLDALRELPEFRSILKRRFRRKPS
jgi:tetratricopeptide (TPR) repeat protein